MVNRLFLSAERLLPQAVVLLGAVLAGATALRLWWLAATHHWRWPLLGADGVLGFAIVEFSICAYAFVFPIKTAENSK